MQRPFRIRTLDHVVLRVRDRAAMVAFYCDVLGCQIEREQPEIGLTQLRAGSSMIDLVTIDDAPREGRNLDHFCLSITPYDEAELRGFLLERGVVAGEAGPRYGAEGEGPSLYLADPEGNGVELKGPPFATHRSP